MRSAAILFGLSFAVALPAPGQEPSDLPAGTYRTDAAPAARVAHVKHLGFTDDAFSLDGIDARLDIDAADPGVATPVAAISLARLDLPAPPPGFAQTLFGANWLNAAATPAMIFRSGAVAVALDRAARVTGMPTFAGGHAPVGFAVTATGGWAGIPRGPQTRIGFPGEGTLDRPDWAKSAGIPPEGSTLGARDAIRLRAATEMVGPPLGGE